MILEPLVKSPVLILKESSRIKAKEFGEYIEAGEKSFNAISFHSLEFFEPQVEIFCSKV